MLGALRSVWVRVTHLGSDELADPEAAKYVILLNSLAVVAACLSLAFVPMLASFLPESRPFLYMTIVLALSSSVVPVLNFLGLQRFARAFFTLHAIAAFTFLAMLRGPQSNFHLYLLLPVIVTMFIYPPRDAWLRNVMAAVALAAFLGLEVFFLGHEPLLPAQNPSFYAVAKVALDAGLVVFVGGFALHIYRAYMRAEDRAENLLRNILPEKPANALKRGRPVPPERVADASIVFLDIAGFTAFSI